MRQQPQKLRTQITPLQGQTGTTHHPGKHLRHF